MGAAYGHPAAQRCRTAALLAALLLAVTGVHAQGADPLHSRECVAARDTLSRAQQDAAARLAGAKDRLASARKRAQLACLGRDSGNAQRVGAPDPAIAVPPPMIEAPRRAVVAAPPPAPPPPPLEIPRPSAITNCDPGGCWDSEGRRLNRVGPLLLGPRGGACTVTGGVVQCP